jgi:uncharacterized protein (TIGR03435 family)
MRHAATHFAGTWAFVLGAAWVQQASEPLKFEVASIKPADPAVRISNVLVDAGEDLTIANVPLLKIITYAYQIRDFQRTGGPGWIGSERYDIDAKTARGDEAASADQNNATDGQRKARGDRVRERLRSLLADRFGLVVHHETKEQTILFLTVAKDGPKLRVVGTLGERQGISTTDGHLQGFAAPMSALAAQLSIATGRVVQDRTGLGEKYDFMLTWSPDIEPSGSELGDHSFGPTIFTALREQLGLRLDSGKRPVEMVVIDHLDRPSAN